MQNSFVVLIISEDLPTNWFNRNFILDSIQNIHITYKFMQKISQALCNLTSKNVSEHFKSICEMFGQIGNLWHFCSSLDLFIDLCISLELFGAVCISLELFASLWSFWELFGAFWSSLHLFGAFWSFLGIFWIFSASVCIFLYLTAFLGISW